MDIFHIPDPAEAPGHHRLVGDDDPQAARLVDPFHRLDRTGLQLKILLLIYQAPVLVNGAVPVQEDAFLLSAEGFLRNKAPFNIL